MNPENGILKPYLYRSAVLHGGLIAGILFMTGRASSPSTEVYRIDFIGPSSVIINRNTESGTPPPGSAAPAETGRIAPESTPDEFASHPRHAPLPRPSMLNSPADQSKMVATPVPALKATPTSSAGTTGGEAAVSADMPDFPYPWYISQVRAALWNQWSAKMPTGGVESTVEFSILTDGSVVDVRIESSSGDQAIDYVALGAVQSAQPFPPLPNGFTEKFLKVHVRFKAQ